jgi:iron complex outermembrane receptor protein
MRFASVTKTGSHALTRRVATIAVIACAWGLADRAYAQGDVRHRVHIEARPLTAALNALAAQTGLQIVVMSEVAANRYARAVSGDLTGEEALAKILRDTGLTYQKIDANTVAIKRIAATATTPLTPLTADHHPNSLLLAQADGRAVTDVPATTEPVRNDGNVVLEEVVVTGSHIRGVRNDTAPVLTLRRDYIERSGFTSMTQLVDSLPMNFSGGQNGSSEVAAFGNSPGSSQNLTRGAGFNLHGLGSVATLTLINGRRVAPAAEGQFVDVSTIPLAAVERVEILTDGASAVYGADAVAGVVNVILRKDFNGAETSVRAGTATRGGTSEQQLSQTFGKTWSGGSALLVADWSKRDPLDIRDRDYMVNAGGFGSLGPTWLLPKRNTASVVFNLDQTLPANFDLTVNALYSHERVNEASTYPAVPDAGQPEAILTNRPVTNAWSTLLGLGYRPFGDWRFELDGSAARMETVTGFDERDLPSRAIDLLWTDYRDRFDLYEGDLKGDGSLFALPAGAVRLAVGGSFRDDQLRSGRNRVVPDLGYQVRGEDHRHVTSAYAEAFVPLVSRELEVRWARRIDLSLAARYDDYSDFGPTWNPKYGLVWTPVEGLDFRASFGSSFRAPSVNEKEQVARGNEIYNTTVSSPDGSGAQVPILVLAGSAPLNAEESRNLTLGFTFRPANLSGTELSVNYFKIDYRDRIASAPFDDGMLLHRDHYGSLITGLPDDAAAEGYVNSHVASGDIFIDYTGNGTTGVRYVLDARQQNEARTRLDGVDVNGTCRISSGLNNFDLQLNVARLNNIRTSFLPDTTPVDVINNYELPLKTRVRFMASWQRRAWNNTIAVNYANPYTNTEVIPSEHVKAWATVDLTLAYDFSVAWPTGVLAGSRISLSVTNLFDVNPPLTTDPLFNMGFDVFNADPLGRYIRLGLAKRW